MSGDRRADEQQQEDAIVQRLVWKNGRTIDSLVHSLAQSAWPDVRTGIPAVCRRLQSQGRIHPRHGFADGKERWFLGREPTELRDRVLELLYDRGPISRSDAAQALGEISELVGATLRTLRDAGLVVQEGAGRRTTYRLPTLEEHTWADAGVRALLGAA